MFDTKADLIDTSSAANVNFPLPWPGPVPQLLDILAAKTNYHGLFEAWAAGEAELAKDSAAGSKSHALL